jgi:hypothetical protein
LKTKNERHAIFADKFLIQQQFSELARQGKL